jgi:hypothetical protein
MIRQLLLRPFAIAEPWLRHDKWLIRRAAQVTVMGMATIWLVLQRAEDGEGAALKRTDEFAQELSSSAQLRDFLHGPAIFKPLVGRLCRLLLLRLSAAAKARERARSDDRNFALRLDGRIDQATLRNLLIWQNHVLPSQLGQDDNHQVDIALIVTGRSDNEARLFDLLSVAVMFERFRNFAVFWDEEAAVASTSILLSEKELARWRETEHRNDLRGMPRDMIAQIELHGSRGGIKLLSQGRKYANDFLKLTLPGRFIVAVGLREREDGTAEPDELARWLDLIGALHARHPDVAIVILNCLAPSQWREWPAYVRFPRHQGLTLQDAICLAQVADGYLGVLDVFGLAAHSAERPGVYVPLENGGLPRPEPFAESSKERQIMVGSRDRACIETAIEGFFAAFPRH